MADERDKGKTLEIDKDFVEIPLKSPKVAWYQHPILMRVYDFIANSASQYYYPIAIGDVNPR
jgi:hypothetical protein